MTRRNCFTLSFILYAVILHAQALRDINFSYLYDPAKEFSFNWKIINQGNTITIYYQVESTVEGKNLNDYSLQWELRKEIGDKEGVPLPYTEAPSTLPNKKSGKLVLDASVAGQLAVAKVYNKLPNNQKVLTLFYKAIPSVTTPTVIVGEFPAIGSYIQLNDPVTFEGFQSNQHLVISYYDDVFPASGPPFATAQARVPPIIKPDSIFSVELSSQVTFIQKGLYLVQQDTSSKSGLAFRVEDDYPKLGKLESLHGPMIYICTKQEFEKLKAAGADKTQFDKIILGITGNTDRARIFMRNYFRRIEQANVYFSSYKEGWKTDRGMMYIIYGLPEEVYLFGDREVWEYKNNNYKGRFTFVKSSTVFDPENYVLVRDKKFTDTWYQMIDLWRKARF